jgi:hypothetical protein
MRKAAFVFVILTCTLFSCIKPPDYSVVPHIDFVSASSSSVINGFSDTITFSFTDGDGDIGIPATNPNDTLTNCDSTCALWHGDSSCLKLQNFDVFLFDSRTHCVDPYASGSLPATGKYKGISGTIQVIAGMYALCNCPCTDTVVYGIILRDMAGHYSNVIHTTPIAVYCN